MANTTVGASVEVEYKSIGEMRKAIKQATSDLVVMQEQFGKTSPQAMEAARKIATLKDRIQDAKEQADLFDPGNKFKAFSNAASQVAAGFSAVQGAMALVGDESEDLQKTLVKVQGAMALSQGLSQLGDLGKAFDELKIVGVRAFTALKGAIGSTGIGLLVIAAGTIVAYWDDIKAAVTGYNAELDKANRKSQENLKTLDFEVEKIEKSRDSRKAQGQTEEQINKLLLKRAVQQAEETAAIFQRMKAQRDAEIAASKRNYNIVKNITRFAIEAQAAVYRIIGGPLDLLIMTANKVSEVLGFGQITTFSINEEITKMSKGLSEAAAQKLFDPKEVDENINKAELASLEAQNRVDKLRAEMNADQNKADKKNAEDKAKIDQDELNRKKEAAELEKRINEDLTKSKLSERDKELFDLKKKYDEEKKILEDNKLSTVALTELYKSQEADINKKYDDEEDKRQYELREKLKERNKKYREDDLAKQKEYNKQLEEADKALYDAKFAAASAGFELLAALAGKNEKLANIIFAVEKAVAIAKIVVDTQKEIASYYAAGAANPINAIAPGAGIAIATKQALAAKIRAGVSIASIIATSIAKYKKGGNTSTGPLPTSGGGGGQTTAPIAPGLGATATAQALNAQAINALGNTALRAYVMNSDIQNNSQRNAYLQRNARIG